MKLIGRKQESEQIKKVLELGRNLLIEGPVGVGKTFLVQQVLSEIKKPFERVDGDSRYTEQKLTGWFDPPLVLKKGYTEAGFVPGPLVKAMKSGSVLFINELNRMPEAVQNILLPAMDEGRISIPKLGTVEAKPGFSVVATQNPREFTATHALSEALMDRFEMIALDYQSEAEELEILEASVNGKEVNGLSKGLSLVRATRNHPAIRRGASVRAVLAISKLVGAGIDFNEACYMALPGRIEMVSNETPAREVIAELLKGSVGLEKKN